MSRSLIEVTYQTHSDAFSKCIQFAGLEAGKLSRYDCEVFVEAICQAHLHSPKIVSFLYALAPSHADESLKHNVLEEMGVEEEDGTSHPDLLRRLGDACHFDDLRWEKVRLAADERLRDMVIQPLMFGTLRDVGLSVMLEVVGFEWMLSRLSRRMGNALQKSLMLSEDELAWFFHHSDVDIGHAEEGIQSILEYAKFYDIDQDTFETIIDVTFRENIFIKRYFGNQALAHDKGFLK